MAGIIMADGGWGHGNAKILKSEVDDEDGWRKEKEN